MFFQLLLCLPFVCALLCFTSGLLSFVCTFSFCFLLFVPSLVQLLLCFPFVCAFSFCFLFCLCPPFVFVRFLFCLLLALLACALCLSFSASLPRCSHGFWLVVFCFLGLLCPPASATPLLSAMSGVLFLPSVSHLLCPLSSTLVASLGLSFLSLSRRFSSKARHKKL